MSNENQSVKSTALTAPAQNANALLAPSNFEMAQRMATALSKSDLIPQNFRDNLPNCLIALEMAARMGASPMAVMQNLYIVHGKPAWSSQFVIAALNSTGRFSPLRFQMTGEGANRECTAWAIDLAANERLEGPPVSIAMAKAEGWLGKNGSKWQTMPELMLRYRAATFFGRLYAPEILMGMKEEGEIIDVDATSAPVIERPRIGSPAQGANPGVMAGPVTNGNEEAEGGKKRGGRKLKVPKSEAPEMTAVLGPNGTEIAKRLKAAGYTPRHLLQVAINEKWVDQPQGFSGNPEELDKVPLASIGEEKLGTFIENWGEVPNLIDELSKPTEPGDALFQ